MISLTDLPERGSGMEAEKTNGTLIMGTLTHVILNDDNTLRALAIQDITGGLYWLGPEEITKVKPHKQGRIQP